MSTSDQQDNSNNSNNTSAPPSNLISVEVNDALVEPKSPIASTNVRPFRILVLDSDYADSKAQFSTVDDYACTPAHYFSKDDPMYQFEHLKLKKKDVFYEIRKAVNKKDPDDHKRKYYDCFFVLADGAQDEDRAGVEVVQALEYFGAAFTGARPAHYELSKPEMKVIAMRNGIDTAKFAVVEQDDDIEESCAHLEFPLIIKHTSGYGSVGMTKKCKVSNVEELTTVATEFIKEFESALIEEFIPGIEATCLACQDSTAPGGVRVYPPVYVTFPEGEDFKHFDMKFSNAGGMVWRRLPEDHPAYDEIVRVTRVSFQTMMAGVGYGRADLRIDEKNNNRVVFLEINPNCGIMYPPSAEDDMASADYILFLETKANPDTAETQHAQFIKLQIREALQFRDSQLPMFKVRLDGTRDSGWSTKACRFISAGTRVLMTANQNTADTLDSNKQLTAEHSPNSGTSPSVTPRATATGATTTTTTTTNNSSLATTPKSSSSVQTTPVSFVLSSSGAIVGGQPFPKANPHRNKELQTSISQQARAKNKLLSKDEVPNVELQSEVNAWVAIKDIAEGEEILC